MQVVMQKTHLHFIQDVQESHQPYSCGSSEALISENLSNYAADFLGNTRSLEQVCLLHTRESFMGC